MGVLMKESKIKKKENAWGKSFSFLVVHLVVLFGIWLWHISGLWFPRFNPESLAVRVWVVRL